MALINKHPGFSRNNVVFKRCKDIKKKKGNFDYEIRGRKKV